MTPQRLRAHHGEGAAGWEALTEPHLKPSVALKPDMQAHRAYADFAGKYAKAEAEYVAKLR